MTATQKCDAIMKGNTILACVVRGVSSQRRGVLLLVYETLIDVSFISNTVWYLNATLSSVKRKQTGIGTDIEKT